MVELDTVKWTASNARLEVNVEKAKRFREDFEDILEMFGTLEEIDTEDVDPAFHPVDVEPSTREDEEEETLTKEEAFRNTDNEKDSYFMGPSA